MTDELWAGLGGGLIGGVLGAAGAVLAVIVDRRIERRNRAAEENRQLQNIAGALIVEIEGFVCYCELLLPSVKGVTRQTARQILLELPPSNPFPVYSSNANRIGEFQKAETAAVVEFFTSADRVISAVGEGVRAQAQSYALRDENANSITNIQLATVLVGIEQKTVPKTLSLGKTATELLLQRRHGWSG